MPPPAAPATDEAMRADLAVRRSTVTPFWWGLRTLFKVGGWAASAREVPGLRRRGNACLLVACSRRIPRLTGCCLACPAVAPSLVLLPAQYRTLHNYRNPEYLGPRVMDKLIFR